MGVRSSPWAGTVTPFLQVLCRLDHGHLGFSIPITVGLGVLKILAGISVSGEMLRKNIERKIG